MKIEGKPSPVDFTPCVVCGHIGRLREYEHAFFADGDDTQWFCAACVLKGEDYIRAHFLMEAERFRKIAASYEEIAEQEIVMPSDFELARVRKELERARVEYEKACAQGTRVSVYPSIRRKVALDDLPS